MTVEEMCGLSLRLTYGHRVRALLVLAPPDLGALLLSASSQRLSGAASREGLSSAQGLSSLRFLPATLSFFSSLPLCVWPPGPLSLAWGRGMSHCARSPSSLGLRPPSRCRSVSSVPRITVMLLRELYFLTCPVSPWHDLLSLAFFSCLSLSSAPTTAGHALLHQHTRELCLLFSSCGSRFYSVAPGCCVLADPYLPSSCHTRCVLHNVPL